MHPMERELAQLRGQVRLMALSLLGLLTIVVMALGGADALARTLVESDSWLLKTKKVDGTLVNRLVVTTDIDRAKIKVQNANLVLENLTSDPSGVGEGALSYNSTTKKLKYYNGSAWVDSSAGGGGGGGADTWRLEYTSATALTLRGIGNGGGEIQINTASYAFSTNPTLANTGLTASTLYRIYAYWTGTAVALEASATAATLEEYGTYGSKSGDASRRLIGLAYMGTGTPGTFQSAWVRSCRNESGYVGTKKYSHSAAGISYSALSTTMADVDAVNLAVQGLFFANEKVEAWFRAGEENPDYYAGRICVMGVAFNAVSLADSETGGYSYRNGPPYFLPNRTASAYVTNASAGLRTVTGQFRNQSGYSGGLIRVADWTPAAVGFQVVR